MVAVAPLVGAWIEINVDFKSIPYEPVAPLVGAWIEIPAPLTYVMCPMGSLLSWERGLK